MVGETDEYMDIDEIREKMFNAHLLLDGFALATPYFPDIKYHQLF